jgi:hypothetical protein
MVEQLATLAAPVLKLPIIRRTRRNHGLEHAAIHVLTQRWGYRLSGRSTDSGFVLLGDVPTSAVEEAVHEALRRMRNGEHNLAIHPNCGTNLATTSFLAALVGVVSLGGVSTRDRFNRLPVVMVMMMVVILFAPLLGMDLQRHITTDGDPGDLEIRQITRREVRTPFNSEALVIHRVETYST